MEVQQATVSFSRTLLPAKDCPPKRRGGLESAASLGVDAKLGVGVMSPQGATNGHASSSSGESPNDLGRPIARPSFERRAGRLLRLLKDSSGYRSLGFGRLTEYVA